MRHSHRIVFALLFVLGLAGTTSAQKLTDAGTAEERKSAITVAERALRQFDNQQWEASWQLVGDYLRGLVDREGWPRVVATLRGGLGDIQSREPDTIGFADSLPDVPPGRYAVLMFRSDFAHKSVREKVVLVREDGIWMLAGYFVRHRLHDE